MSRIKAIGAVLLCACLLVACGAAPETPEVTEPTKVEFATKTKKEYETRVVERMDFVLEEQSVANYVYTDAKDLICDYANAVLVADVVFAEKDTFQKGDIIASYTFEVSQSELMRRELAYQQAITARDNQVLSYENRIAQYTEAAKAEGVNGQIAALQAEQARNDLKLYRYNADAALEEQWQQLEDYRDLFSTKFLIAPEDGMVIYGVNLKAGTVLKKDSVILTYTTRSSMLLKLNSVPRTMAELASPGMEVTIGRGKQEITGHIVASPVGIEDLLDNQSIYVTSDQFLELDDRSYYTVVCKLMDLKDLLVLPKKYISYDGDTPYVMLLEGTQAVKQEIVCGLEYKNMVCILDGLSEGQLVITNY